MYIVQLRQKLYKLHYHLALVICHLQSDFSARDPRLCKPHSTHTIQFVQPVTTSRRKSHIADAIIHPSLSPSHLEPYGSQKQCVARAHTT